METKVKNVENGKNRNEKMENSYVRAMKRKNERNA